MQQNSDVREHFEQKSLLTTLLLSISCQFEQVNKNLQKFNKSCGISLKTVLGVDIVGSTYNLYCQSSYALKKNYKNRKHHVQVSRSKI